MFRVLKEDAYRTTVWASGCTTELFIYPEEASFAERRFLFRVSKATVEADESTFTALPGVTRWIMPLDGHLNLSFANDGQSLYTIQLAPFQPHCFKGEWQTKSLGKVSDFNLMLKDHAKGHIHSMTIESGTHKLSHKMAYLEDHEAYAVLIHVIDGTLAISDQTIKANETGVFVNECPSEVTNTHDKPVTVIFVEVVLDK